MIWKSLAPAGLFFVLTTPSGLLNFLPQKRAGLPFSSAVLFLLFLMITRPGIFPA